MTNEYKLTVISGPSACGKDTVVKKLVDMRDDMEVSVSCTTRSPREGEIEGESYYFITREEFQKRLESGRMLEYNEYAGNLYGTPKDELEAAFNQGKTVILVIDVNGGRRVKEIYPGAQLIFLLPPSIEELKRRMDARNSESPETAAARLKLAQEEMKVASEYDLCIVNDDLDICIGQVMEAIEQWQKAAENGNTENLKQERDMNKTPIGRLLEENDSAYSLVIAVAKRARDIVKEADEKGERLTEKPVTLAIDEFDKHEYRVSEKAPEDFQ